MKIALKAILRWIKIAKETKKDKMDRIQKNA